MAMPTITTETQKDIEVFTGLELLAEPMEEIPYIVNPLIPSNGITLLSGEPGIGKTAFGWGLGQAMATSVEFLGHATRPGKILYLSLDMTREQIKHRVHKTGFAPRFRFVSYAPYVNCLAGTFKTSLLYRTVQSELATGDYALVVIDALVELIGSSLNDDNVPSQVKAILKEWIPQIPVLILHHTRKRKYADSGYAIPATGEQSSGSQFWRGLCCSHLIFDSTNVRHKIILRHDKSQVDAKADDLEVYVDFATSTIKLWADYKAQSEQSRLADYITQATRQHADWDTLAKGEQVRVIMGISGKSRRTVFELFKHKTTLEVK